MLHFVADVAFGVIAVGALALIVFMIEAHADRILEALGL